MKMKSTSQIAGELTKKSPISLTLAVLVLCASPAIALADSSCAPQTNWSMASGDWFVGTNWSNGVPTSAKSAQINNRGTATIGSTGGTAQSCDLTLGGAATDSGTLVVDNGVLNTAFDDAVGGYGRGVLTITNGGTVTAALAAIAAVAGSKGAVTVAGTTSQWTLSGGLDVGAGGTGLLTITDGGKVTAASVHIYPSGTLTGNGTVTTTNGTTTMEGTLEPSSGRLTISGGDLTFNGTAALMLCDVVPASADNVYVSGGRALLTGKLKVKMTGTFTPGTIYTLLHADSGLNNTEFLFFSITYPTGQCFTPDVTYDANNVYLNLEDTCH